MPGHPLSIDFRWRVVVLRFKGWSIDDISDAIGCSPATTYRVLSLFEETGNVERTREKRAKHLSETDLAHIWTAVDDFPSLYLFEFQDLLAQRHGMVVSQSGLVRAFYELGLTRQKMYKMAVNRDEERVAEFIASLAGVAHEKLVFLDEARVDHRCCNRSWGRGPRGQRLINKAIYINGERMTVIAAMNYQGILAYHAQASFCNGDMMEFFGRYLLAPVLPENSVVVLDNCSAHCNEAFINHLESLGHRVVFLPPYSPALNPIEAWSEIKATIRRVMGRPDAPRLETMEVIELAMQAVTAEMCVAWMKDCGYG